MEEKISNAKKRESKGREVEEKGKGIGDKTEEEDGVNLWDNLGSYRTIN